MSKQFKEGDWVVVVDPRDEVGRVMVQEGGPLWQVAFTDFTQEPYYNCEPFTGAIVGTECWFFDDELELYVPGPTE